MYIYIYNICIQYVPYIYIVYHIFIIHDHIFIKLDKILQFGGICERHTPERRFEETVAAKDSDYVTTCQAETKKSHGNKIMESSSTSGEKKLENPEVTLSNP